MSCEAPLCNVQIQPDGGCLELGLPNGPRPYQFFTFLSDIVSIGTFAVSSVLRKSHNIAQLRFDEVKRSANLHCDLSIE